jgi:hypothetical protein
VNFKSLARQKHCRACLADVHIPDPWDVKVFCDRLAFRRGRSLQLLPVPAVAGAEEVCGAWVPLPDSDVIFVKWHTSPWHREQIILHECSHMILGHPPSARAIAGWVRQLLPIAHWDPEKVAGVLMRGRYDTPVEREAETLAGLIEARAQRRSPAAPDFDLAQPAEVVEVLGRFARALGLPER